MTPPEAVDPAGQLCPLITDTLRLWGCDAEAEWRDGRIVVSAPSGVPVFVRPAPAGDRPVRWLIQLQSACWQRPAASVVGMLTAVGEALGARTAGARLRVAPAGGLPDGRTEPRQARGPASQPEGLGAEGLIPILVVTGFLGSGKTTLIARMLRDPAYAGTAVIVNEWADIGIDHNLLAAVSEGPVRLSTGCLCCAVRGDLANTLLDLDRRRRFGEIAFERVVIETSGLADPAPILQVLLTDPALAGRFRTDDVVTLVDAVHGQNELAGHVEARRQITFADRVLISKTDLAAPSAELQRMIASLNPVAPAEPIAQGRVPPGTLFRGARRRSRFRAEAVETAQHTQGISCVVLEPREPMPAAALLLLLEALADHGAGRVLRAKGLVHIAEAPDRPALVQGVQHVFEAPDWLDAWPDGVADTRLVLIGAGLPPLWPQRLYAAIAAEVGRETARQSALA